MTIHDHEHGPCDTCTDESENKTYVRLATIAITVDRDWLTGGELLDEQTGWSTLLYDMNQGRFPKGITVEWSTDPEIADPPSQVYPSPKATAIVEALDMSQSGEDE